MSNLLRKRAAVRWRVCSDASSSGDPCADTLLSPAEGEAIE